VPANWIDTPLLVYRALADHPAAAVAEQQLATGEWASSVQVLLEFYQVVTRDYAVPPDAAAEVVRRLARSPVHWASMDAIQAARAVEVRTRHRLESTDAALLILAQEDHGILVTQDRRLLREAEALGVAVRNPIDRDLAASIARWEEERLPPKGVARLLRPVETWLRRQNSPVADQFIEATAGLTALPS
jgi:predicted nucleic acid-binding protein